MGDETISTTPKHPFWVEGSGWVDAGEVSAGDKLVLADGERATIVSVTREKLESPLDVYNFEVADFHTYFVASAGVWVHNACGGGAKSAANYARLKEHYRQAERYGSAGVKHLQNGRIRYYGKIQPAAKRGLTRGRRLVREWNPTTGAKRTWHESVGHRGGVRRVRLQERGQHRYFNFFGRR